MAFWRRALSVIYYVQGSVRCEEIDDSVELFSLLTV